jgi:hypothetical protein
VSRRNLKCRHTAPSPPGWELEATGSSPFCEEFQRFGRWLGQGLGVLGRELETLAPLAENSYKLSPHSTPSWHSREDYVRAKGTGIGQ